jgi:Polyketide cyclase / dehydrase and lipid transport/3-demethylubiquinone-9 3-methyltransferase
MTTSQNTSIQPYLFFDGRCDEALEFYRKALGAEVGMLMRFKDSPEPCGDAAPDKVMHASFRVGGSTILASDGRCSGNLLFTAFRHGGRSFWCLLDGLRNALKRRSFPAKRIPMLKKILIAFAIIVVVFVVVVAMQPANFRVVRTAAIAAPPEAVFAQVNDFHNWEAWSPWAKLDPAMKQTYEGSPSGKGAIYTWTGNHSVGEGRMTLTESHPAEFVRIDLDFIKPFKGSNKTEFTFRPEGKQTTVTWSMDGQKNFITKAFGLFMSMDRMVGRSFEQGLAQMKTVVETSLKK